MSQMDGSMLKAPWSNIQVNVTDCKHRRQELQTSAF